MARNPFAPLQGKPVAITNVQGAFRSCGVCGGQSATVDLTPVGLHAGRLICEGCGAQTSYLSREHLASMLAAHRAGEADTSGRGAA
jgi:hypothetical protein